MRSAQKKEQERDANRMTRMEILLLAIVALFLTVVNAWFVMNAPILSGSDILHHNWTYKHHKVKKSLLTLLVQFHATSWPAILGSAVMVSIFESFFGFNEFLSLVGSSMIALLWNFGWSKYVVWRKVTEKQIQEIVK